MGFKKCPDTEAWAHLENRTLMTRIRRIIADQAEKICVDPRNPCYPHSINFNVWSNISKSVQTSAPGSHTDQHSKHQLPAVIPTSIQNSLNNLSAKFQAQLKISIDCSGYLPLSSALVSVNGGGRETFTRTDKSGVNIANPVGN